MPLSDHRRLALCRVRRVSFVLLAVLWMSMLAGSGARAAAISFAPPVTYDVRGAVGPVTADLDGDGSLDMVGSGALGLYVFYGIGDGTLGAPFDLGIIGGWTTLVDVNGDGRVDIVTGQGDTVGVLLNQGQRSFAPPVSYPVGHQPSGITAGDFNGDGWADLSVAHHGGNNMGVMLNQGDGTFAPMVFYPGGHAPARIACADFNRDGNLDLAMSNYVSGNALIYFGDGRGNFQVVANYNSGGMYPAMILTDDLNNDGWPDLATANTFGNSISVFLGNGTGLFRGHDIYPTIQYPHIFASADLDGDGAPDIVAPNNGTGFISILQNRGDGTFLGSVESPSGGSNTRLLTVGDLNGDGLPDVITGNESSNNFSVLINNTRRPDCAVRSLTLDRAMLLGGSQSATATVTLTSPAPEGGAAVQLASTNPAVSLPAAVTIPEGVTSARFTLETTPVTFSRYGAVTARYNGTVQRAAVAVRPPRVQLSGPIPNPVTGGQATAAKVILEAPAGPGGQTISLDSDTPPVVPAVSVMVPAGATEATFSIPTYPVADRRTVVLQAAGPGGGSLRLQVESLGAPLPQPAGTASLPIYNPANGHWYQEVQGPGLTWAQARDAATALSYAGLQGHLATVTSAEEVQFILNHVPNSRADSTHWIGAYQERRAPNYSEPTGGWRWVTGEQWEYTNWNGGEPNNAGGEDFMHWLPAGNWNDLPGGGTITAYLVEYEPAIASLLGITVSPVSSPTSPTAGGQPVNGTVTLAQPAGPNPVTIYLASDRPWAIAVPVSVTVPAGQKSATFTGTVYPVAAGTSVVLTAIGPTVSASVTVPLTGLGLPLPDDNGTTAPPVYNPANGHWYQEVLSAGLTWAQARDAAARLSYAGLPGHLTTVTSAEEVQFILKNVHIAQPGGTHWIGAYQDRLAPDYREPNGGWRWVTGEPWGYTNWNGGEPNNAGGEDFIHWLPAGNWNDLPGGATITGYLVEYEAPIPQFAVSQVTITPNPVTGGQSATGTVTLSQAAGANGITVYLGSSHPDVAAVLSTVSVAAGETTATFTVTTHPVSVAKEVIIGASGPTGSASVSVQVVDSGAPLPQVSGARTPPVYNPANGHWYQEVGVGAGLTWAQARAAAAGASYLGYPGHLVTVTSAEEHQFLLSHLPQASECWIGLYQDRTAPGYSEPAGGWRWITGEAYSWNHWHGEPNNANGNEDLAVMRGAGSWNDLAAANLSSGYIIEYEAIEGPLLRLSARALDFGAGGVGMMGETRSLTLTNVGTAPLSISEITIDGEAAADFGFSAGGEPGTLAPGESRPVTLFFRPTVSGNCVAQVNLTSNSRGPVEPVTLTGLGERRPLALLAVTPGSLEFGPEPVGLSGTLVVLLHNSGNMPVNIGSIVVQGPNAADFTLPMGSCQNSTLAPGSICLLNIRFSPTGTGTRTATLVIPSNAGGSPQIVPLAGTGTAPLLRLSANSLTFSIPTPDHASAVQTLSFTNHGDAPLTIEGLNLAGTDAGRFQIISDTGQETLDPGATRTVKLAFSTARVAGATRTTRIASARIASVRYSAVLQIQHNDTRPDSPRQVQLTAVEGVQSAPTAPTAPASLRATSSPTAAQIDLTWQDTSANEGEFVVMRKTGTGVYARLALLPANRTSYADTTASPGITYTYILRATNSAGASGWSNEASATRPAPQTLAAPTPLRAAAASATQVNLAWTDRSSSETNFVLLRKTGNGVYTRVAVLNANATQHTDASASPNTSYTYIVRAINGDGFSPWTNEVAVTTPPEVPPLAPGALKTVATSPTQVELTWNDRSSNEKQFVLLRKTGTGVYQRIAVLPANTTSYTDSSAAPLTTYTYIMRAVNEAGVSAWTNEPSATTPSPLPAKPANARAVAVSATRVNVTWEDKSSNETQFVLLRKVGTGVYQRIAVLGANTTSYADTTVSGGVTYTYILRAVNAAGVSGWSNEPSVSTP